MLEFKKLNWEDKDLYSQYYKKCPVHYAEYSFFGLWGWRNAYPCEIAFDNDLCWIRANGPIPGICGPLGDWNNIDWEKALANFNPGDVIFDVPKEVIDLLSENKNLKISGDRDQYEYIYSVQDLISLKGKNFSHKRNRFRAFVTGYEWDYYNLTPEMFQDVINFQEKWRVQRDLTMNESEAESLLDEDIAIHTALEKWNDFNFLGGVIKVNDEIIAYTIAEELDGNMIDIRFEKAFGEYAGSYQAINQLFLKNQCEKYKWVNREEDMGEAGLREAKMSYNPVKMLEKYRIDF